MHSIKGSAAMMGYPVISETAHAAEDLFSFGVIERIVGEQDGLDSMCSEMKAGFLEVISECKKMGVPAMLEARYEKYRKIGGETL